MDENTLVVTTPQQIQATQYTAVERLLRVLPVTDWTDKDWLRLVKDVRRKEKQQIIDAYSKGLSVSRKWWRRQTAEKYYNEITLTAVDELVSCFNVKGSTDPYWIDILEQVKTMEKEQIVNAYTNGLSAGRKWWRRQTAEKYYNEKFS